MKTAHTYLVLDSEMPPGVVFLKHYETQGVSMVECAHSLAHRLGERCLFCRGDAHTTSGFTLPVKRTVVVAKQLREAPTQAVLF